ncbi:hypothetical protein BV22DRAFT_598093 [Leucogyrophana mollusca]|uniref:Uncharacterized protein n=1 Tax=Leucogyrophana mollusca TaxID=85980 RepID=A0ACB8BDA1_9AGAM|nr:hypothetical protein BV22DRAFT_598093 [Leucogyrophana mollusca]
MPTHQSWHNRLTNFEHSSVSNSYRVSASIPTSSSLSPRVSASTDALASLAWIGAPSLGTSASTPSFTSGRGDVSVNAIRGDSHLSMAMAVDDHDISDDVLVEKLEKIRRESSQYEQRKSPPSAARHTPDRFQNTSLPLSDHDKSRLGGAQPGTVWAATPLSPLQHTTYSDFRSPQPAAPAAAGESDVDPDDASIWQAARKALLCVREILRTERKYQEALKSLLDGQTLTQPPDLMLGYLPGLLQTSETLLKGFIDDPSAWGVSTAFISSEDDLETAMVSWCAVAGNFFVDRKNGEGGSLMGSRLIFRRSLPASSRGSPVPPEKTNEGEPGSPLLPPMLTLMNEAGSRIKERQKIDDRYWRRSVEQGSTDSHGSSCRDLSADETHRKRSDAEKVRKSSRRLSVRDLAIQPTQRVMRYVLLYRDLLESTPATSPSRALVERALEAASRIAEKCDRAQNNVAFIPRRA